MQAITQPKHLREAQRLLNQRLDAAAERPIKRRIGFPGGSVDAPVRYIRRHDLWYSMRKEDNRWWNVFGLGNPKDTKANLPIVVEINPSFTGSRQCAGLFLEDSRGRLYLAHTGRVGGGRKGIGKQRFLAEVGEDFDLVGEHGDILIGRLDGKGFLRELAEFVQIVKNFKDEVVSANKPVSPATQDARVPPKARLHKYGGQGESDEHKRLKLHVANNPTILGLGSARVVRVEYPYISGDRVDLMFELANGTHAVIEIERRGERATLIGAYQAIKYRALLAAELGEQPRRVAAVLVAHEIPQSTVKFCREHGIQTRVIPLARVTPK
jgi:hypothetical protein